MLFISSLPEIRFALANKALHMAHPWLRAAAVKRGYDESVFALATKIRLKAWKSPNSERDHSPSLLSLREKSKIKLEIAQLLLKNGRADLAEKSPLLITLLGPGGYHEEVANSYKIISFGLETSNPASDKPIYFSFTEPVYIKYNHPRVVEK